MRNESSKHNFISTIDWIVLGENFGLTKIMLTKLSQSEIFKPAAKCLILENLLFDSL